MEDVCGLHKLEQGLPKRQLPSTEDRSAGEFHSRTQAPDFYGCILRIQTDKNGRGKLGKNYLHHKSKDLLLQSDALWVEKCRSNLPKVGKQNIQ